MNHVSTFYPLILAKRLSIKFDLKVFWILGFILTTALLLFYIFQQSSYVLESYQVQNYQKKRAELLDSSRDLEIKLNKINYLENIAPKVREFGLERINTIHYIQVIDAQALEVATRRPGRQ